MKKLLIITILALFLLTACGERVKENVDADTRVQQFLELFSEASYAESAFSGGTLEVITDVIAQDCGAIEVPESLVRATYTTPAATLVAYVDTADRAVLCVASKLNQDALAITRGDPSEVENGTLVTVNGETITLDDVQVAVSRLPEAARAQTTVGAIVNQLVDQELLQQAAADIEISDDEVDASLETAWTNAGFADEESFAASLEESETDLDEYRRAVRGQLRLQALLEQEGVTAVDISDEVVRDFYLQNTNAFLVSEQVRFRQVFIGYEASGGQEAAEARLRNVLEQLGGGLDFCAAVQRYSDDDGSVERCGEYITAKGVLLPELEAAIFALSVNQSTVAASQNGFHIIVVLGKQPTSVIPYEQAASQVANLLQNQAVQQRLNLYLLTLRAEAELVDYS